MKSILYVYLLFSFTAFSSTPLSDINFYDAKSIYSVTHSMDELSLKKYDSIFKKWSDHGLIDYENLGAEEHHCCSSISEGKSIIDKIGSSINFTGPTARCNDVSIILDNSGAAILDVLLVDDGSTDGLGGSNLTYELSQTTFSCDEIGENDVMLTVTNVNGDQSNCDANVTVLDVLAPVAVCNEFTIGTLDANGDLSISPSEVDAGSSDNCSIEYMELNINYFDCSNLGQNEVALTIFDSNGNSGTCFGYVVVEDYFFPVAVCNEFTIGTLDANGDLNISPSDVDAGSSDNCSIESIELDVINLDCSSTGQSVVELTVTDESGNVATCQGYVIAEDDLAPSTVCNEFTVATLDENGLASVLPSEVDAGSSDNCSIDYMELDVSDFDCSNLGQNVVELTVVDQNGNSSLCWGFVVVEDDLEPLAVCEESIYVTLDVNGISNILPSDVDAGSSDNCGLVSFELSQDQFDCSSPELNTVSLTVTDSSGNTSECSVSVIIDDFPDMSLLVDGGTISSVNTSDSYQWLDCDNGNAPITGANDQSYAPGVSGNYALEFNIGGCTYISECVNVTSTGVADIDSKSLTIYPNPTAGEVIVDFQISSKGILKVYNLNGQLMNTQRVDGDTKLILDLDNQSGLYIIEFLDERGTSFFGKVLKE